MFGSRTILALCFFCTLGGSALAAQGAVAAPNGLTAFTCKKLGPKNQFKTEHCRSIDGPSGEYGHVEVTQGLTTELSATNEKTNSSTTGPQTTRLHTVISGIPFELQSTGVHGTGTITNSLDPSGEHYVHAKLKLTHTSIIVTKPAEIGCKVKGGEFTSNELTATSTGQGDTLKFQPAEGLVLTKFEIEGCESELFNGLYELKGSVAGTPEGSTVNFEESATTLQKTLTLRGLTAGIDGKLTLSGRANPSQAYTPLSFTTKETP